MCLLRDAYGWDALDRGRHGCRLNIGGALDCFDDAGKFDQRAIAHELDDTTSMLRDFWFYEFS